MSDIVIRAEGLGKRYRRGLTGPPETLRDALTRAIKSPLAAVRRPTQEQFWALRDVGLEVRHGEVLGLIGFQTWRQNDFYDQLEELQRSIISYAGIRDEKLKCDILVSRMVSNLFYMLKLADRVGDQRLVRQVAKYCQRFRPRLTVRQTVTSYIAAITGRCPRLHRAKRLGSRSACVE
jgi:hypothetical protein